MPGQLILIRAAKSRPSGEWNDDDFDVLNDGAVVGRILKVHAAAVEKNPTGAASRAKILTAG